jgi:hypothetical protein
MRPNGRDDALKVTAGGTGVVGHAGAVLRQVHGPVPAQGPRPRPPK